MQMNPRTNVQSHKTNNYHFDLDINNIAPKKPKFRTQEPNNKKSSNKTSVLGQKSKQPNKQTSNTTPFPPIIREPNNFPNVKNNKINNPSYKPQNKGKPKTEVKNNKMDIDYEYNNSPGQAKTSIEKKKMNLNNLLDKKTGKVLTDIKSNQMDFYNEYDKSKGQAITAIEKKKMNLNNLVAQKVGKDFTEKKGNKLDFDKEKGKKICNPKTEIKSNKINIDTPPKITQNIIQNQAEKEPDQAEKESEINNLYIDSINNVRLPEGLVDITFDALKGE